MAFIYLYRQYKRKQAARVAEAEKITQAQTDVQAVNPILEGEGSSPVSPSPLDSPKLQALKPPELDVAKKKSAGWLGLAKEQWMLMGALALPIFLETLDYTGMHVLVPMSQIFLNSVFYLVTSCCNCSTRDCCKLVSGGV